MPEIIQLTGKLNYSLTLDPSSWLFDDRKINLDSLFDENIDHNEEEIKKETYSSMIIHSASRSSPFWIMPSH